MKTQHNAELVEAFSQLSNALAAVESRLNWDIRFALKHTKEANEEGDADGIRYHSAQLVAATQAMPLRTASICEATRNLSIQLNS